MHKLQNLLLPKSTKTPYCRVKIQNNRKKTLPKSTKNPS